MPQVTPGPYGYRVQITPVSQGTKESDSTLKYNISTHDVSGLGQSGSPINVVFEGPTEAQMTGLLRYIAMIKSGNDITGPIETAIAAAL